MLSILIWIKLALASFGVFISWFIGGADTLVYALIIFIVVDYVIGVMKRAINKELSSDTGMREIFKKIIIILLVGMANIIDIYLVRSDNAPLRTVVTFFYISNQGISILENAALSGLPVPEVLKNALMKFQKKTDSLSKKE